MPSICTESVSPNNCGHRHLTIGGVQIALHESELEPLSAEELVELYTLAIRHRGVALANLLNRVVVGDEATNVKVYDLVPPGSVITMTNVGTVYKNVLPGANGQRIIVDFTGCTEFLVVLTANLVGTGPFGFRVIRDSDDAVLFENDSIALTGERELDTGWLPIPLAAAEQVLMRLQAKSTVTQDDPIVRRAQLLVR